MRPLVALALCALALPVADVGAQKLPEPEIGFRAGMSRLTVDAFGGGTGRLTILSLPTSLFPSPGGVHFMFFLNDRFSLEPHLGYTRMSSDGNTSSLLMLALQPNYFFTAGAQRSGYLFGQLGLVREHDSFTGGNDTESQNFFALGVGYRRVVRRAVSTRYEVRFRRFNEGDGNPEMNEISLLFGLGVVIPRSGQ